MRIGIVSDSHGKTKRLRRAVQLLAHEGIDALLHCGDICTEADIDILTEAHVPVYAVAGNMDTHADQLAAEADREGVTFAWEVVEIPLGDGEYLVATHGHDEAVLSELIHGEQFPYVCHGHTHRMRNERIGPVRVINPGAIHHPKHPSHPTVVLLDTATDRVYRFDVPE